MHLNKMFVNIIGISFFVCRYRKYFGENLLGVYVMLFVEAFAFAGIAADPVGFSLWSAR